MTASRVIIASSLLFAATACGEQAAEVPEAPCPEAQVESSSAPRGDMPPNHADNRAYLETRKLSVDERCKGEAEAGKIRTAVEQLRVDGRLGAADVRNALAGLGYQAVDVSEMTAGTNFVVDLLPICLEGSVTTTATEVEAHGVYMEGGCARPSGGH
ncbi:hypothetical protein [Saccharopolyspora taberi]|uniref:Lipoprotein n=1 Tax=Saccharopolyspora taberi TaxID=60895 RepID=A0ABN3VL26_9PSEU